MNRQAVNTIAVLIGGALVAWTFVLPVTAAKTPARTSPNVHRPTDVRQATTTTTTPTPPTTTPLPGDCQAFTDLNAAVGWPAAELDQARRIMFIESRCDNSQHNPNDPSGGSYGQFQVNGYWCVPNRYWPIGWLQEKQILETCDQLFDAETNARAALAIFNHSRWRAWGIRP